MTTYRTELYNLIDESGAVSNGWLVAMFCDGCRKNKTVLFGADKAAADSYCAQMNV